MSLNIGTEAHEAVKRLAHNPDFKAVRDGLYEVMRARFNQALDGMGADAIGYARALRDIYLAFEAAATGKQINQVPKPTTEKR